MHKVCTGKVCFRDSSDISREVDRRIQPRPIYLNSQLYHSDTRWFRLILYDLYF